MLTLTPLHDAAPLHLRPTCILCRQPAKPRVRTVWVAIHYGREYSEADVLATAAEKLGSLLKSRDLLNRLVFVRLDSKAMEHARRRSGPGVDSISVGVWVRGDYDGRVFLQRPDGSTDPVLCTERCAIEFATLAAKAGWRPEAKP